MYLEMMAHLEADDLPDAVDLHGSHDVTYLKAAD
jgi:hypothetical protein